MTSPEPVATIDQPAKLIRFGSMLKQLLEEFHRDGELSQGGRDRLQQIYEQSVQELRDALPEELAGELDRITAPLTQDGDLSEPELRVAEAQLVGWLEGLFQGIQATMMANELAARSQLQQLQQAQQEQGASRGGGTYL